MVLKVPKVVVVVVTKFKNIPLVKARFLSVLKLVVTFSFIINLGLSASLSQAAVLGAERVDVLYHSYEGGGMKIDGPAILL